MESLFNIKDGEEFIGIKSLNKANKKGTPQYEEWLRKYREKRGVKAKPEEAAKEKAAAKEVLESSEFKKYTTKQMKSLLEEKLDFSDKLRSFIDNPKKKAEKLTLDVNGTEIKVTIENGIRPRNVFVDQKEDKPYTRVKTRYPSSTTVLGGATGDSFTYIDDNYGYKDVDSLTNALALSIVRKNSAGHIGGDAAKRRQPVRSSSLDKQEKAYNDALASYKPGGKLPTVSPDLLNHSKDLKDRATSQFKEFLTNKFKENKRLKRFKPGSWGSQEYDNFLKEKHPKDAVFLSTNAFRSLTQELATKLGHVDEVTYDSDPLESSVPKPVFHRENFKL